MRTHRQQHFNFDLLLPHQFDCSCCSGYLYQTLIVLENSELENTHVQSIQCNNHITHIIWQRKEMD